MYNLIVDKQNRVADVEKIRNKVIENEELKKVNKLFKEENIGNLAKIESSKSQVFEKLNI